MYRCVNDSAAESFRIDNLCVFCLSPSSRVIYFKSICSIASIVYRYARYIIIIIIITICNNRPTNAATCELLSKIMYNFFVSRSPPPLSRLIDASAEDNERNFERSNKKTEF